MKSYTSYLFYASLLLMSLHLYSCDEMDDIQKQYADEEEIIYLGKVDSVKVIPGYGRAKLTWEMSADPRIERVRVYWDNNQESIVKEFHREVSGVVKDSLIIENLAEGNYTFELRSESDQYDPSLPTFASGSVWGPNRGDDLGSRSISSFDLDHTNSAYTLMLTPVQIISAEDSMVFSELTYTNTAGSETTVRVNPDSSEVTLENFATGGEFTMRDAFVSASVIDTVYNNYRVYVSPEVINHGGNLQETEGQQSSDYFALTDTSFLEWTGDGELISFGWDGSMVSPGEQVITADLSRDSFRTFFYYGNNKFIAISHDGNVVMHQLVNDTLSMVLTPAGAEAMGVGFNFEQFVRGAGFFYSVTSGTGDLKTWFAREDATWGSPNGSTVATNFDRFQTISNINSNLLLAIDQEGNLWNITVKANGEPAVYRKIGTGWDQFDHLVGLDNNVLAIDQDGKMYVFDQLITEEKFWVVD